MDKTIQFLGYNGYVEFSQYPNGRTAILLKCDDGSPLATATINLPEVELNDGEVIIKNYSENSGIVNALVNAGVVEFGRPIQVGSFGADCWICTMVKDDGETEEYCQGCGNVLVPKGDFCDDCKAESEEWHNSMR